MATIELACTMDETCSTLPANCHYCKTTFFSNVFLLLLLLFVHLHYLIIDFGLYRILLSQMFLFFHPITFGIIWIMKTNHKTVQLLPRDTAATYQPPPLKIMLSAQSWTKHRSSSKTYLPKSHRTAGHFFFLQMIFITIPQQSTVRGSWQPQN